MRDEYTDVIRRVEVECEPDATLERKYTRLMALLRSRGEFVPKPSARRNHKDYLRGRK